MQTLMPAAQLLAVAVATQVAQNSMVGGRYLASSEVMVTFSATAASNQSSRNRKRTTK